MERIGKDSTTKLLTDLPLEILSRILSYLPYMDIQDARLACRKLYSASLDDDILDREIVVFYDCFSLKPKMLLDGKRTFPHLQFKTEFFSYDADVWSHLGPTLISLSFYRCKMSEDDLFAVLNCCNHLKNLGVFGCDVGISSKTAAESCVNHDSLTFEDNKEPELDLESFTVSVTLDPRIFWKILNRSPNLTSLSIDQLKPLSDVRDACQNSSKGNSIEDQQGALHPQEISPRTQRNTNAISWLSKVWPRRSSENAVPVKEESIDTPPMPLTIPDVFAYVKARGSQLKNFQFTFDWTNVAPLIVYTFKGQLQSAITKAHNLRLEKMTSSAHLSTEFLLNQKDCQELVVGIVYGDKIEFICKSLPRLKKMYFTLLKLSSASAIKSITHLQNLISLRIDTIRHPALAPCIDSDIFTQLCGEVNTTLKSLELVFRTRDVVVSPECVKSLTTTYPALSVLTLVACNGVTDLSVQSIFRNLTSLESLKLYYCFHLSDAGLRGTPQDAEDGTHSDTYSIARLKRLRHLQISCCPKITGKTFTEDLKFPELQQLHLGFNNVYYEKVMPFVKTNSTIERLKLGNGPKFTYYRVFDKSKTLTRLRYISLSAEIENSRIGAMLKKQCRCVTGTFF